MTARVDTSVIIPALDAADTLPEQLAALAAQDYTGTLEVIVADNGSTDATAEVVGRKAAEWPHVRVVDASERRGVCRARNVGASHALGANLLFCDADDVVEESWCTELVDGLAQFDAVGGAVDFEKLNPSSARYNDSQELMLGLTPWPDYLPYAHPGNFGIRADVFREIGGWGESFSGCEDVDMCWRIQQSGHSLGFTPRAVMHYRLRTRTSARCRYAFRYASDHPQLYGEYRSKGMPSGRPLWRWLRGLGRLVARAVRRPGDPRARLLLLEATSQLFGYVAGSIRYRTWYLGPR